MTVWMQRAFDHLNERLFAGRLERCPLALRYHGRWAGWFSSDGPSIWMRPSYGCPKAWLATLAHEMAHYENALAGGYAHDRGWKLIMGRIGLVPQGDDERMWHYIDADGPFLKAADDLLAAGFRVPVYSLRDYGDYYMAHPLMRWLLPALVVELFVFAALILLSLFDGASRAEPAVVAVLFIVSSFGLWIAYAVSRGRIRPLHDPEETGEVVS